MSNKNYILSSNAKIKTRQIDENKIEFICSKQRITYNLIYSIFFALLLFAFSCFWFLKSFQTNLILSLSSIPVIIISFTVLFIIVGYQFETQTLLISNKTILLKRKKLNTVKTLEIDLMQVSSIRIEKFNNELYAIFSNKRNFYLYQVKRQLLAPTINYLERKEYFFELAEENEQKWMIDTLNDYLEQIKNKS